MDPFASVALRTSSTDGPASTSVDILVQKMVTELDCLGIVSQLGEKTVGGVALTRSYYQHALETEGKPETVDHCQLVMSRRVGNELKMCPVTTEQLEAGAAELPREAALLAKLMGPTAVAQFKWTRVPAVVIFGCFVADEAEMEQAESSGIPVSPSMSGPHQEELITQLEVFYKQYKYPDHKCFWLRDWGFMIFGCEMEEAVSTFDDTIKSLLITSSEATDAVETSQPFSIASAFKRLGSMIGRSASEPSDVGSPSYVARGPAPGAVSEPTSPGLSRPETGPFASSNLPDDIKKISTTALRTSSDTYRIPSFQTGLKPW